MIIPGSQRILLATRPVDFRRGHDALAATARPRFSAPPGPARPRFPCRAFFVPPIQLTIGGLSPTPERPINEKSQRRALTALMSFPMSSQNP